MKELSFEVSFQGKPNLEFRITSSNSTFGTLITQSAYLWELNPENVFYLTFENEPIFLNDSPLFPFLASMRGKVCF